MTGLEVLLIRTPRYGDDRGWFQETWSRARFEAAGIQCDFVQDNHSRSVPTGVVRGLHFQKPPFAQAKLVRCVRGAILDVAVDLRSGAQTFGRAFCVRLDADSGEQLFIPDCFAHGFVTLKPDTEVIYKVSAPYSPEHEAGLDWADPELGIDWTVTEDEASLSPRDRQWPRLRDVDPSFSGWGASRLRVVDLGPNGT